MPFFYKPHTKLQRSLQDRTRSDLKAQATVISKRFLVAAFSRSKCIYRNIIGKVFCKKRAFRFASFPGIMTVEAAIAVPVFLIGAFTLLDLIHMLGVHQEMLSAMAGSAHISSVRGYDEDFAQDQVLTELVLRMGSSCVDFDRIQGGMAGIDYWGTDFDKENGDIHINASCQVSPSFSLVNKASLRLSLGLHTRAFVGGKLLTGQSSASDGDGRTVYVAENGVVYHNSRSCAYIDLSLHGVLLTQVSSQRNSQGGRYYPCERCMENRDTTVVYITDTGTRYHGTSQCPGLSRTVYEMTWTQDCILPACSRCGR